MKPISCRDDHPKRIAERFRAQPEATTKIGTQRARRTHRGHREKPERISTFSRTVQIILDGCTEVAQRFTAWQRSLTLSSHNQKHYTEIRGGRLGAGTEIHREKQEKISTSSRIAQSVLEGSREVPHRESSSTASRRLYQMVTKGFSLCRSVSFGGLLCASLCGLILFSTTVDAHSIIANSYIWAVQLTGRNDIQGNSIVTDSAGNVYTLGEYQGTVDFDPDEVEEVLLPNRGNNDIYLSKLDQDGNYLWAKTIGGGNIDVGTAIAIDGDDNLYTTGYFRTTVDFDPSEAGVAELTSPGNDDIFISKLDSDGNFLWANGFGNVGSDRSLDIAVDGAGNVYATGYFSGTIDFDPGVGVANLVSRNNSPDVFVAKFDTTGAYVWAKKIGGSSTDRGNSIAVDATGNVHIVGYFSNIATLDPNIEEPSIRSAGSRDIFVLKLDPAGTLIWAHAIGSIDSDVAERVALGADSTIYVLGEFRDTVDFNPGDGVVELTSSGSNDAFVLSLDKDGTFVWVKKVGGVGNDIGIDLALETDDTIQVIGLFEGSLALEGGLSLDSAGESDIFLLSYSKTGVLGDAFRIGGTGADVVGGVTVGANDSVYATGAFVDAVDFDPGSGAAVLTSREAEDAFVLKLAFVNVEPSAIADSASVDQGSIDAVIDVLENDSDPDVNQTLSIASVGMPDKGGAAKVSAGKILYTPAEDFIGTEVFSYTLADGAGGRATGQVTVTVVQTGVDIFLPYVLKQ